MTSTRDALLTEGMRLFGEQGYAATSVARIEEAAGLSPGSGSLYKHFRSKEALLTEGIDRLLRGGGPLVERLRVDGQPAVRNRAELVERLTSAARAGLRRLDEDRDLTRLLFRGLDAFPELLRRFGDEEIVRFHRAVSALLAGLAGEIGKASDTSKTSDTSETSDASESGDADWPAVALVLQGAVAQYWLLADLFDGHPTGVDEERFIAALVSMAAAMLTGRGSEGGELA